MEWNKSTKTADTKENHFNKLVHWNQNREQKVNKNTFSLNIQTTFLLNQESQRNRNVIKHSRFAILHFKV